MTFNITIMAIDQHNHSLYDQTNVQILTYDEDQCLPTFKRTLYIFNTTEHQLTPYEIGNSGFSILFFFFFFSKVYRV